MSEQRESPPLGGDRALLLIDSIEGAVGAIDEDLARLHRLGTLGLLAAGIAHEINNLLTPVLGYAQLAQANPNDEALRDKALERAVLGVEAAARIAEAMLGFAGGPARGDFEADICETVNAAVACIGRPPERDGINLTVTVEPRLKVAMSPVALQQVILNLLINAIKVLRQGGGAIEISAQEDPLDPEMIQIQVADSGPGIPADLASTLFEPFATGGSTKGDRGWPSTPSGHGLGLAVCRGLIEQARGTIDLAAAPPQSVAAPANEVGSTESRSEARAASSGTPGTPGEPTGARFILRLPRAENNCGDHGAVSQQQAA